MISAKAFVYVLDKTVKRRQTVDRVAVTRNILQRLGFEEIRKEIRENDHKSVPELKRAINLYLNQGMKPVIFISTWGDIASQAAKELIIETSSSIFIADECADLPSINPANGHVASGPVLQVVRENVDRVSSALAGAASSGPVRNTNKSEAIVFAMNIFPKMVEAVEALQTSNRGDIASYMNDQGLTAPEGGEIRQQHLSRWVRQAEKNDEWGQLLGKFPKQKT